MNKAQPIVPLKDQRSVQSKARIALIGNQAFSLINFRGPLVTAMVEEGMSVFALAPDYCEETRRAVRSLGAEPIDYSLERTGTQPIRDFVDLVRLTGVLRRLQPTVTFAYFAKPVIYGTLAASMARVPHRIGLIEGAGYIFTDERRSLKQRCLAAIVKRLYRTALARTHKILMLNDDDAQLFSQLKLVDPTKVTNIGGIGVDLDHFTPTPLPSNPITFLLAARLLGQKGIRDYANAARIIHKHHPTVRFVLAGGIDESPDAISEAEVSSWVEEGLLDWHGHVSDIRKVISLSTVFVLPSYYREGVPRSTQEALAMGRPIITTDWVGCRDTVQAGVNGLLVPVRDSIALADAMEKFIENPGLAISMGTASRNLAETKFDVMRVNRRIIDIVVG